MNIWFKATECPVCKMKFKYPRIKSRDIKSVKRDTDFMYYYEGVNPLYYQITVCPQCLYSDKYTSFEKLSPYKAERVRNDYEQRKNIAGKYNFDGIRNFACVIKSYELAALCGISRKAKSDEIAGFYLRAAWVAREQEKTEIELHYLSLAYQFYLKAYQVEYTKFGKLGEVGFIYLIGEIARRLKKYDEALKFFSKVIEHPDIKKSHEIERLTRNAWQETKALKSEVKEKIDIDKLL
ncbi:MAG: DUF2225 domain-containing protein [Candidatus Hydrogenedentota bacterium]